jgi:hypothetical protein
MQKMRSLLGFNHEHKYPENPTAKDKHVISLDEIAKELGMYMYSKIQYDLNIYFGFFCEIFSASLFC